ncbi:hypothetical protein C8R45DRAFT_904026, partial [Mycena sanguinolenta]
MPIDAWDGDTDKMSAQSFLRAFHRDVKVTTSSADKAKAFRMYLVPGSEADDWFSALPVATKTDMDAIDLALETQWPSEATVQPTQAEWSTELLKSRITMEELGTKVKVADREVWAHHAWGNKMMRLAAKAGVSKTTTYIEQVRVELPKPLRGKINKTHADWAAFVKAIRDVDTVELELEMKEWREEKEQRDKLAKLLDQRPALQASPTASIRTQLANARIGALPQAPARWPPAPQAPRAPYQALARPPLEAQPPLEGEQRRVLLAAIANITHHPDTEAGRRAHGDQQQEWYRVHGNVAVSVNTPYPLRPGRAPVNSGECYRCGYMGHTNYLRRCDAPPDQCISMREQQWRRIAAQALKEAPAAVRAVGAVQRDARTAPEEQKTEMVLGRDEPSLEDVSPGPHVRRFTSTPMYQPSESHVIDLYAVGIGENEPKRASVPFICEIEVEGPRGERERIRALEDDGAMVNAMCTGLYSVVRHRIGELRQSGRTLRMANGALVPSIGYWEGYIHFGGVRVQAGFEVFPSGGSWSFLFGKPLLESFGAVHDYATDTITVRGEA